MMISAKTVETKAIADGQYGEGDAAEITRAIFAVRETYASVLKDWDGRAAKEAEKAFVRFDAELNRYKVMIGRLTKLCSGQGDRDVG